MISNMHDVSLATFQVNIFKGRKATSDLNNSASFLYENTGVDKLSLEILSSFVIVEIN